MKPSTPPGSKSRLSSPEKQLSNLQQNSDFSAIGRSVPSNNPLEIPQPDPNSQANYMTTNIPDIVTQEKEEPAQETTHQNPALEIDHPRKAQIVLLSAEIERLNSMNYRLVRENEVLKASNDKSIRERDLETKLAVVLAENEKLNQVIEEMQNSEKQERHTRNNPNESVSYPIQLFSPVKSAYPREDPAASQEIYRLRADIEFMKEEINKKNRDLEQMKKLEDLRIASDQALKMMAQENQKLKSEIDSLNKSKSPTEQKVKDLIDKIKILLNENENLTSLLNEKINENKELKNQIEAPQTGRKDKDMAADNIFVEDPKYQESNKKNPFQHTFGKSNSKNAPYFGEGSESQQPFSERDYPKSPENSNIDRAGLNNANLALENEIKRLKDLIQERNNENQSLTLNLRLANEDINSLKQKLYEAERKTPNINPAQIDTLITENMRLNDALRDKIKELDILKDNMKHNDEIAKAHDLLLNEHKNLLIENKQNKNDLQELKKKLTNANLSAPQLLDENQRLREELAEKNKQIEALKELERKQEDLKDAAEMARKVSELFKDKTLENQNLTIALAQANEEVKILQEKLSNQPDFHTLIEEKNALEEKLKELADEHPQPTGQVGPQMDLEIIQENFQLKQKQENLLKELQELKESQNENPNLAIVEENYELKQKLDNLNNELNEIKEAISEPLSQESSAQLIIENSQLKEKVRIQEQENDFLRNKLTEYCNFEEERDELKAKVALLVYENTRINGEYELLRDKILEMEKNQQISFRERLESQSEFNVDLEDDQQKTKKASKANKSPEELLKEKLIESEEKLIELQNEKLGLEQELQNVIMANQSYNEVNQDLARRIQELSDQQQAETESNNQEKKLLEERLANYSDALNEIEKKTKTLSLENERLVNENAAIKLNQSKDQENSNLLLELEKLGKENVEKKIENETLGSKNGELENVIRTKNDHIDKIANELVNRNQEIEKLKAKVLDNEYSIETIKAQENRLNAQQKELERLNALLLAKDEELRDKIETSQKELDRLTKELSQKEDELNDYHKNHQELSEEGKKALQTILSEKIKELENAKTRISKAEIADLQARDSLQNHQLKINELENTIELLSNDRERLNRTLHDKAKEMEELRLRLANFTGGEAEIRMKVDNEYKRIVDDLTEEMTKRFAEERHALEGHILGMNQRIQDLLNKIQILMEDNENLTNINDEKIRDLEALKQRYLSYEKQKEDEIDTLRRDYETKLQLEHENGQKKLRDCVANYSEQLDKERKDHEERSNYMNSEITKLQSLLNQALSEAESWKRKYQDLDNERLQELEEITRQFELYKQMSEDSKELAIKFAAERTAYETQIGQLQQKILDLENELGSASNENERLTELNLDRFKETENWKKKYDDLESTSKKEILDLKTQLDVFKANNLDVKQLAIKYGADKAADENQIKQLKQINESYKTELEKLYDLVNQRRNESEALQKQNEELRRVYEKLMSQLKIQENESLKNQNQIESVQKELEEITLSRDEYKRQAEKNSIELTRKNKELVDKIQELEILKMKYEEAYNNYQLMNAKLLERLIEENKM